MLKPFQKKFLKKWFSPQISLKPLSPQETEQRKTQREKEEEEEEEEEKLQVFEQVILRGESTSTSKIIFDEIPFSPPPSYHFKNLFQNHWESFLNSFWTILYSGNTHDLSCTLFLYPWGPYI
jgi:hypothetical protein